VLGEQGETHQRYMLAFSSYISTKELSIEWVSYKVNLNILYYIIDFVSG